MSPLDLTRLGDVVAEIVVEHQKVRWGAAGYGEGKVILVGANEHHHPSNHQTVIYGSIYWGRENYESMKTQS